MVRVMGQRSWLITTVAAALFGLLVPPCALACLESFQEGPSFAQLPESPCHEENSDSMPSELPGSQEDCGCEIANEDLLPGFVASLSGGTLVVISSSAPRQSLEAGMRWALTLPEDTDLPSPDILLLKSTLLI